MASKSTLANIALGNVTIVDFYADWCGPCKAVDPMIKQLVQSDPEIAVRKIDIVEWGSAVAKQYHVSILPRV
jgi:thioredoxin 1